MAHISSKNQLIPLKELCSSGIPDLAVSFQYAWEILKKKLIWEYQQGQFACY